LTRIFYILFLTILTGKQYEKVLPNIVINERKSITEKIGIYDFVEKVWPANLAFLLYVETVKMLHFLQYVQLSMWGRCNASDCGARGPGFDSLVWKGFYVC